ncbi:MAG: hypothetical protein IPM74_01190 [Crocinitomicaceae bacterium]|nr:hypothetical protein [Crocinitomicaceae bacterium]MBK8924532.1 hypothetical protein [Crocinitomicaceae bacterium]
MEIKIQRKPIRIGLYLLVAYSIYSCAHEDMEFVEKKERNRINTVENHTVNLNIDSLMIVNRNRRIFLDFWEGMSPEEVSLVSDSLVKASILISQYKYQEVYDTMEIEFEISYRHFPSDSIPNLSELRLVKLSSEPISKEQGFIIYQHYLDEYSKDEILKGEISTSRKRGSIVINFGETSEKNHPLFLKNQSKDSNYIFVIEYNSYQMDLDLKNGKYSPARHH